VSAAGSRGGRVVDVKSVRGTLAAVQGPRPVPLRVLPGAPGRRMIRGVDSPDHGDKQHDYDDKSAGETDDGTPSPDDPSYGNWVYGVDPDRFDAGFDEDEEVRECLPLVSDRDREGDAADQPSDEPERRGLAEDELNTFLTETLKAFADHVVNAIAIAHPPLGAAIKLVDLVSKAGQAVSAVDSDEGPEIDIPIPCGAVTFMFRMPLRGEPGEPGSPITAYIAPGGPLVGALGISPARHAAPEAPVGAEPGPGTDAQGGQPGADEAVRYYGDVAVARMKLDLGGNPIGAGTGFVIGVGANPGLTDLDEEIRRFEYKVEAGAEYAVTQPVFDLRLLENFLKRIEHCRIPVVAGIWPLVSVRNAEFMKNELRVSVPDAILERMARAQTPELARAEGVAVAREMLIAARQMVQGAQVSAPNGRYTSAVDVLEALGAEGAA